jgi:TetR/AcrR family transcriptional regulator, transcriptional repressor for nem operon
MGRASRQDAEAHRAQAVDTASRLFRERGVDGVGLKEIMARIGLTPGGFYRQFDSKDELVSEATTASFDQMMALLDTIDARHDDDRAEARTDLLNTYLSAENRDDPGTGCATTGLAPDSARAGVGHPLRSSYVQGVQRFADRLAAYTVTPEDREEQILLLATLVGALTLARATNGTDLSDDILAIVRNRLGTSSGASTA